MQYTIPTWRITSSEDIPEGGRVVRPERVINVSGARRNRCLKETDDIIIHGVQVSLTTIKPGNPALTDE
jgi:hypothetical protein